MRRSRRGDSGEGGSSGFCQLKKVTKLRTSRLRDEWEESTGEFEVLRSLSTKSLISSSLQDELQ